MGKSVWNKVTYKELTLDQENKWVDNIKQTNLQVKKGSTWEAIQIKCMQMNQDQQGINHNRSKYNILHLDNDSNKSINQLNPRETIRIEEEFNQKDRLLQTLHSSINYKFSNNNKTKRDMNCKCKNCSRNNSKWLIRNKPKWHKNNTMLCSRINSYSSCKFKRGVAQALNEELRAHVRVNSNSNSSKIQNVRLNQAAENLNIKLLLQTQVRLWLKLPRVNRQLSINKLKTNICNSKFKNNWCEPQPKTKIGSSAPNANMKSDEKHSF